MRFFLVIAATALVIAAGCIRPDDPNNAPPAARADAHGGSMSGDEKRTDSSTVCTNGGLNVGGNGNTHAFCAQRVITVQGSISGIPKIDVDLSTFNGDVKVHESSGDAWGFTATLKATGSTADEASARIKDIAFSWSHTDGSAHFVQVKAQQNKTGSSDEGLSTDLDVTMPAGVTLVLVAATGNGDLHVQGGQTDGLSLSTGNGDIDATTKVTQADLRSGNGDAKASLTPTGSGRIGASVGNGKVDIALPEDASHGYTAEMSTGNGDIKVSLHDGKTSECPSGDSYTPPCNHRTFETTGYGGRATQTSLILSTGNGDVTLRPS